MNMRVKAVNPNSVLVVDKATNETIEIPFGVCVWSTGVTGTPLCRNLSKKLGQPSPLGLIVDGNLKVKGTNNVYAIGDCAVIEQPKLKEKVLNLFLEADTNNDGGLDVNEFSIWMKQVAHSYPQLKAKVKSLEDVFQHADTNKDGHLSVEEFKIMMEEADASVKSLPTTAQVAAQEGKYLGKQLKKEILSEKQSPPFVYHQLAQFAYIGHDSAVGEVPFFKGGGFGVFMIWKGVYLGYQQSMLNTILVGLSWLRAWVFGRDISRY